MRGPDPVAPARRPGSGPDAAGASQPTSGASSGGRLGGDACRGRRRRPRPAASARSGPVVVAGHDDRPPVAPAPARARSPQHGLGHGRASRGRPSSSSTRRPAGQAGRRRPARRAASARSTGARRTSRPRRAPRWRSEITSVRTSQRMAGGSVPTVRPVRLRHSIAAVAAGLLALLASGCTSTHAAASPRHPPVVMIVFDEFSTVSLLDRHGRIDPVRYPNFAWLAHDGNWFPYATASLDETGRAMRSLMAGRTELAVAPPTLKRHPQQPVRRAGPALQDVDGPRRSSNFCPPRLCPDVQRPTRRASCTSSAAAGPSASRAGSARRAVQPAHLLLQARPAAARPLGLPAQRRPLRRRAEREVPGLGRLALHPLAGRAGLPAPPAPARFTDRLLG